MSLKCSTPQQDEIEVRQVLNHDKRTNPTLAFDKPGDETGTSIIVDHVSRREDNWNSSERRPDRDRSS